MKRGNNELSETLMQKEQCNNVLCEDFSDCHNFEGENVFRRQNNTGGEDSLESGDIDKINGKLKWKEESIQSSGGNMFLEKRSSIPLSLSFTKED